MRVARRIILLTLAAALPLIAQPSDSLLCLRIFSKADERKLSAKPIGTIVAEIAREFVGSPYEANTLDRSATETIVTNLHSFDCVTLIENVLALARCVKFNHRSFEAYRKELGRIRYRRGVKTDYSSRLHYFSEWIADNERKGNVQDMTHYFGGMESEKRISFMSEHRASYAPLASDSVLQKISAVEASVSALRPAILAVAEIRSAEQALRDGDIVAITTSVPGLDVSHTGIAVRGKQGEIRLLHAPDVGGKVQVSAESLSAYVRKNKKNTGIMVARPVDLSD